MADKRYKLLKNGLVGDCAFDIRQIGDGQHIQWNLGLRKWELVQNPLNQDLGDRSPLWFNDYEEFSFDRTTNGWGEVYRQQWSGADVTSTDNVFIEVLFHATQTAGAGTGAAIGRFEMLVHNDGVNCNIPQGAETIIKKGTDTRPNLRFSTDGDDWVIEARGRNTETWSYVVEIFREVF